MVLIVCLDEKHGMLFNRRRQSQDAVVQEDILALSAGKTLWMNGYSAKQFPTDAPVTVAEDCLAQAGAGEFCFIENLDALPYAEQVEQVIVYQWNRRYPADFYFTLPLDAPEWVLQQTAEFAGKSHEKITKEVYYHECTQ